MANSKQAAKRARQANDRRLRNRMAKSDYRTEVKKLRALVGAGKADDAQKQMNLVERKVDKAAKRGVIHTKTASRIKSRAKTLLHGMSVAAS